MVHRLVDEIERSCLKPGRGEFRIGDTVDVHVRIIEGEKERIQVFRGIVIARRGRGTNEYFTVRRLVAGEGVERLFPLHSPMIDRIEVKKHGKIRRAKLYYLRERTGKATKVAERRATGAAAIEADLVAASTPATPDPAAKAASDDKPEAKSASPERKG